MRNLRRIFAASLALALVALPVVSPARAQSTSAASAQQSLGALERGYRTGYSDGYQAGYSDSVARAERDYRGKDDYQRAQRAYSSTYGSLEDYRDGYQQGFEVGYETGYERRNFDSTVPANLSRRGTVDAQSSVDTSTNSSSGPISPSGPVMTGGAARTGGVVFIPADTVMLVELMTNLSSDASQRGDRFQARVLEPGEYEDAVLDGRVTRVKRAGKVKGQSELQLTFDQIRLDNRWANINAQVIEVVTAGTSEAGSVDPEGGVKGKDSTRDDVTKIGAATAIGAIIGVIAGGGKGAAIGAAIGGAVGTGGVLTQRGQEIRLYRGQQLRIRTSSDTRIQ
ncbi:MAG TPA: hypothetical protein VD966_00730 [Pyrinomonadaceae bacterium]|nr:hypothetical protein [Pyrinomonadaceae bacterium]